MNNFLNLKLLIIFEELNVLDVISICLIVLSLSYLYIIGMALIISPTLDP